MSIDRSNTYSDTNPPPTNGATAGANFLDQYGGYLDALIDTAMLRLANVAGTDTITATAEPFAVPSSGLVSGMKFTLVPAANNTGAVTLNIDSRGAEAVVSSDSSALTADTLVAGTRYFLEFDGTNFVIVGQASGGSGAESSRTTYDTTAVWENNYSANTLIEVELWGAGGGGSSSSGTTSRRGGGGAGYARKLFKASELPTSLTITIPSGGAVETDGGDATFGSLLTGYGGGRGLNAGFSGGGGGENGAGTYQTGGSIGGADGVDGAPGQDAKTIYGGASGCGGANLSTPGGDAAYGGAGGGGASNGGKSAYGGNGGDGGSAGQRPGGGGGTGNVGGAGRCIVTIYG